MWPNPTDEDLFLEQLFSEGAPVEEGVLLPMPSMPILRPPADDEVSTGEMVAAGRVKQKQTLEEPPQMLEPLYRGDEITLPDGSRTKLQWVAPDRRRVGVGPRKGRNYTFYSMEQFVELSGRQVAEDWKRKRDKAARDEGMPPPTDTPRLPAKMFVPKGFTLYPHQLEGIEFLERRQRGLIADEMGLGKTITAIVPIRAPAVVVCPSLLKVNWAREINRWHPKSSVAIINGTNPEAGAEYFDPAEDLRKRKLAAAGKRVRRKGKPPTGRAVLDIQQKADIIIINYDILTSHADWIMKRGNEVLIADEAHYLKNLDIRWDKPQRRHVIKKGSQRGRVFFAMQQQIPRLYLLTGTPILNRVRELFPLLNMLNPDEWGDGFRFCQRYCAGDWQWVEKLRKDVFDCNGRSHSDELHERIKGVYMMRHTKEQELAEFPEKKLSTTMVSMPKHWREEYRRASRSFMAWVSENGGPEAVARAQMAEQLVQLGKLRAVAAQGKVAAAISWIVRFFESTQRPLVVFALHEAVFDAIEEGIDKVNTKVREAKRNNRLPPIDRELRVARITGKVSAAKRQRSIDAFQQEGALDVLLYSIPIATGTTLTRASDALFLERMWRPADLNQAEDRLHRIGQKNTVFITYLDAEGTIDAKLGELLVRKSEAFSAVIDGIELETDDASAMVFGEMFRDIGFDISEAQAEAIVEAARDESAEMMKNPNHDDTLRDPYVQASLAGVPFERFIGERGLTPNPRAVDVFDEEGEYIDTFDADEYDEETFDDDNVATDSWHDPL
jgi:SWI/SNF-related matrix-associated actin-dependent regulator 1 of chromatin subfamily A